MGAWQKTIKLQEPGNSPGHRPEVVERPRVAEESVAGQCRTKCKVSAGAAGRILDTREIELKRRLCKLQHRRERTPRPQVPRWKSNKSVHQRILIIQYASSPR